jgi:hypothetical protein
MQVQNPTKSEITPVVSSPPEKKQTLIALHSEYQAIVYNLLRLCELGDEGVDLAKLRDEAFAKLVEKADSYGFVIEQLESFGEQCKRRVEEWQKGVKASRSAIEGLKFRMRYILSQMDEQKITGSEFEFYLTKPTEKFEVDDTLLPKEYKKAVLVYERDEDKIEADMKEGKEIPGVTKKQSQQLRSRRPK